MGPVSEQYCRCV